MSEHQVSGVKIAMNFTLLMVAMQPFADSNHEVQLLVVVELGVTDCIDKAFWVVSNQLSFGIEHGCFNPLIVLWPRQVLVLVVADGHYFICLFFSGFPDDALSVHRHSHEKDLVYIVFLVNLLLSHHDIILFMT